MLVICWVFDMQAIKKETITISKLFCFALNNINLVILKWFICGNTSPKSIMVSRVIVVDFEEPSAYRDDLSLYYQAHQNMFKVSNNDTWMTLFINTTITMSAQYIVKILLFEFYWRTEGGGGNVIVLRVLLLPLWISFSTAEKNMIKATWSLAIVCFCFLFLRLIS